ncbi:pentatricopeptide repeat-containing protein At4g02750 [Selaginella moellendorffii]|uniref:pentatricopeptide repeat-containing protein At4g02750 n=1 Tax=Selaginella moellendorffii TaxID=88036 RepID=UPI000D1D018E|nr:pentatricopeptide repeat-containing protein At4g02750 [Selaginella moellendorffii]|eukprot:XP_024531206.1 pentatricopeptide repeat-containing protein At4g02750 [Selaginella moellendorffii]
MPFRGISCLMRASMELSPASCGILAGIATLAIAELKAAVASSDLSLLEDVRAQYFKAFCYDDGYVDAIIRSSYTSLMHSLGTHGHLVDVAENVYKRIPSPDAAAFNALLAVYVKNGYYSRAQKLFAEGGGDRIDTRSFNIMISSLPLLEDSEALFERAKEQDVFTWTSLASAYVQNNRPKAADLTIRRMIQEGIEPTRVAFLVWVACGEELGTIVRDFDFVPDASHYGQVVVNLARGGKFAAAVELASCLPDDPVNWIAVLSAARMVDHVVYGEIAAEKLLRLKSDDDKSPTVYIMLGSIYYNTKQ